MSESPAPMKPGLLIDKLASTLGRSLDPDATRSAAAAHQTLRDIVKRVAEPGIAHCDEPDGAVHCLMPAIVAAATAHQTRSHQFAERHLPPGVAARLRVAPLKHVRILFHSHGMVNSGAAGLWKSANPQFTQLGEAIAGQGAPTGTRAAPVVAEPARIASALQDRTEGAGYHGQGA